MFTLLTCPNMFSLMSNLFQLVVIKENGEHVERLSPWAPYVTRPEKIHVYEQRFWNPPQDQVTGNIDKYQEL